MRTGDRAAFAILVRRYGGPARRTAAVLGAGADTDDVVQEAFVKAYRALGTFRVDADSTAGFRPWLLRIVANETRNARRAAGRRAAREAAAAFPALAATTDDRHDDALEAFRRQVMVLPEPQRQVIACRYLLDLDEAQTAQVLGISRGTVKSRTHRALARLRDATPTVAEAHRG